MGNSIENPERAKRSFKSYDAHIFDHLKFVKYEYSQETYPETIVITYYDTPENDRLVNECYEKYINSDAYKEAEKEFNSRRS